MVIKGAAEDNSPLIISAQEKGLEIIGYKQFSKLVRSYAEEVDIPVVLHLDHGKDIEVIKKCLESDFTSVMFDGSHLPLDENIEKTALMVKLAQKYDASTEGELGKIPGDESGRQVLLKDEMYTDPNEAIEYIKKTGVDALAVSIGTIHYMQEEKIIPNLPLLKELRGLIDIPLVLHGGAAVTDVMVKKLVSYGINKYNINYYLNEAFVLSMKKVLNNLSLKTPDNKLKVPVVDIYKQVEVNVIKEVKYRIKLLGSANKI
jgi:fructose-bisphosphate aldolase, class II